LKILIVSQYFWPETFTVNELARTLKRQGHEITVATGKPNYPDGKIFGGYRALGMQKELYDNDIEVVRVPLFPRGTSGGRQLLLNYVSFVCFGLVLFPYLLRGRSFDVIFVHAASPNCALPAIPLKWIKGAHLALWVLDLWPDSLSATGFIRSKPILRGIGWLVRFSYWCADTILVQSRAFVAPVERYAERAKVHYFPNSSGSLEAESKEHRLPAELVHVLEAHFCAVFAGNIGTAQAVETLVESAAHLADLTDVRIVLVGSGSKLQWVSQAVAERKLPNVVLAGRFPQEAMPELFRHASCLLVTLKNEEVFSYVVPAKVQAYLAAGRPIAAALNGEGARIIGEAGAGLICAAEDSAGLATCLRALYAMPSEERRRMGESGRRYFLEHFEMNRQALHLVRLLEERRKPLAVPA